MMYTIPLALQDFVPVVCAGLGFFALSDALTLGQQATRKLAFVGASLITVGGLLKASWKLTIAASNGATDIVPLDKQLLFTLAVGFTCLATALMGTRRALARPALVALGLSSLSVGCGLTLFARGGEIYRAPLLLFVVLGNTTTLVIAMRSARAQGLGRAPYLIAGYLLTGFIMPMLARLPQTIAVQWVEQSVNSVGAIGLFFGSRSLRRALHLAGSGGHA